MKIRAVNEIRKNRKRASIILYILRNFKLNSFQQASIKTVAETGAPASVLFSLTKLLAEGTVNPKFPAPVRVMEY
jgi:hypothetical protein